MLFSFLAAAAYVAAHAAAGAAIGGAIGYLVGSFIDEVFLTDAIEEKYPDAFKILIKEKKKNAVNVGIFDIDDMTIEPKKKKNAVNVGIFDIDDMTIEPSVEIESEQGVSDELYVGQVIYI